MDEYWYYHPGKNEWIPVQEQNVTLVRKAGYLIARKKNA